MVFVSLTHHPRWTFHFTLTPSSWLNAVKGFFAQLKGHWQKYSAAHSIVDLQAAINGFIDEYNRTKPKPLAWNADPDKIIATRNRGFQTLEAVP